NLVRRLMRGGHSCVVYDVSPDPVKTLEAEGATGASSLEELVAMLDVPRAAWLMLPAAYTGDTVASLAAAMSRGDIIIHGHSSDRADIRRAAQLQGRGIHYVDVGTSGGVYGLERGFCLMIGGEPEIVAHLDPIFMAMAPGVDAAARTEGRGERPSAAEQGYL